MGRLRSHAYATLERRLEADRCVILDGAMATELGRVVPSPSPGGEQPLWDTWALARAPDAVLEISRKYATIGCDVISTNTWGIATAIAPRIAPTRSQQPEPIELARRGIRVAREAVQLAGREGEVAVAFSIKGEIETKRERQQLELLPQAFEREPPDLILIETMISIREGLTVPVVRRLAETGIPVWVSFRCCGDRVSTASGQRRRRSQGDDVARAVSELERIGAQALLLNCVPPTRVPGMLSRLRGLTTLPLGVYPSLGRYTSTGWIFDGAVGGPEYAELAAGWREQGARIIGGCCGVRPEHVAAAREAVLEPASSPLG